MKRVVLIVVAILVAGLVLAVLVSLPFYAQQTNPPVKQEPAWDSQQTKDLARRACFDCHSNETVWPIYSRIPVVAILVTHDVTEGRQQLNFSEWTTRQARKAREAVEKIETGEMPMRIYLPLHPTAQLSAAEKQQLIQGLQASLK